MPVISYLPPKIKQCTSTEEFVLSGGAGLCFCRAQGVATLFSGVSCAATGRISPQLVWDLFVVWPSKHFCLLNVRGWAPTLPWVVVSRVKGAAGVPSALLLLDGDVQSGGSNETQGCAAQGWMLLLAFAIIGLYLLREGKKRRAAQQGQNKFITRKKDAAATDRII